MGECQVLWGGWKNHKKGKLPWLFAFRRFFDTPYISILKGCLQNELIIYTLAHAHFTEYEDIPDPRNLDSSELPGGALILALQAVNFALHLTCQHYTNSVSVFFRSNMLSNFGKPGKVGPDRRIKDVRVLNAGQYKLIHSLTIDRHWVPIFNTVARILTSTRKKKARSKSNSSHASSEMLIDETPEYILVSDED